MTATCGQTTDKSPKPCEIAPGFLVADEQGRVVQCCGLHIGTAMPDPDVVYTVVRTSPETAAHLLGRLVARTSTPSS